VDLKLFFAVFVGKLISFLIKSTGGGATAAPGLYALKIDPNLIQKLSRKIPNGSILISGTNGKTTTSRLAFDILSSKYKIIHNRQGSNLLRGIASTLIKHSSLNGSINARTAIWEVDEAVLPQALEVTAAKHIVLLNLFRDQLDRYGEVDSIRNKWQKALKRLPQSSTLILNADDPGISILKNYFKGKTIFFGVSDDKTDLPKVDEVGDITHCLNCGSSLIFKTTLSAHLGKYFCSKCSFKRPNPQISASKLKFKSDFSTKLYLSIDDKRSTIHYSLPGLYNVYNVLAATALGNSLKVNSSNILSTIKNFSAAFGRFQKIEINDKNIFIFLIKNPTGANEVLRAISILPRFHLLAALNDNFADGKDVSWIWDTNWEILKNKTKNVWVGGTRRWDLAIRLKYAGIRLSKKNIYKEGIYSIKASLAQLNNKDTLVILPTYTALLTLQKSLTSMEKGITKWQNQ